MAVSRIRNIAALAFVVAAMFSTSARPEARRFCMAPLGYTVDSGISLFDCFDESDSIAQNNCPQACDSACHTNWTGDLYRANNCQFSEDHQRWETGSQECYCVEPGR